MNTSTAKKCSAFSVQGNALAATGKIIHRTHFDILEMNMEDGKCGFCDFPIEGIWA
jgi:hypothetical protein